MKNHVALIDPLGRHGGMHYYDHDLANALVSQGLRIELFSPPTGLEAGAAYRLHPCFENVFGAGKGSKLKRAWHLASDLLRAVRGASQAGCDTIVLHVFKWDVFEYLTLRAARLMGLRSYAIVHDVARLDAKTLFEFRNAIVRLADGLVVHNDFSRETLVAGAPGARGKTVIMRHGNYVDRFPDLPTMAEARDRLDVPQEPVVLLFFGNPRREKGLALLIEALEPLREAENLLLLIAGKMKPDDEQELRDDIRRRGLEHIVRLDVGHVPDDRMPLYYRSSSMIVLPYHRIYESGVALMAMSFGRTILASDLPVFNDLVAEGANAFLFRAHEAASLTTRLRALLEADEDWEALGLQARDFVIDERSWARSGEALANFMNVAPAMVSHD